MVPAPGHTFLHPADYQVAYSRSSLFHAASQPTFQPQWTCTRVKWPFRHQAVSEAESSTGFSPSPGAAQEGGLLPKAGQRSISHSRMQVPTRVSSAEKAPLCTELQPTGEPGSPQNERRAEGSVLKGGVQNREGTGIQVELGRINRFLCVLYL